MFRPPSMSLGIPSEKAWGKTKKVYYDAGQRDEKGLGKSIIEQPNIADSISEMCENNY